MATPSKQEQKQIVAAAAKKYGIDPAILWGVYGTETSFGANVSNSGAGPNGGAKGYFQFEDATAKSLGVNPFDFKSAAFGAAKYLSQFKSRGTAGMLSAYNAGPAGGIQQGYVNTTLKYAKTWDGTAPTDTTSPTTTKLASRVASSIPTDTTTSMTTVPDSAAYQAAVGQYAAGQLTRQTKTYGPNPLAALLPSVAPNQADYVRQVLTQKAAGGATSPADATPAASTQAQPHAGTETTGMYVNPYASGSLAGPGRIDEGTDETVKQGGKIGAVGNAKIVGIFHNFYKGMPYIVYQLTDGIHAGKRVYESEYVTPAPGLHAGQIVKAGQTIAYGQGKPIESGWAGGPAGSYLPEANHAEGGSYNEGDVTPQGQSGAKFLGRLGAKVAR